MSLFECRSSVDTWTLFQVNRYFKWVLATTVRIFTRRLQIKLLQIFRKSQIWFQRNVPLANGIEQRHPKKLMFTSPKLKVTKFIYYVVYKSYCWLVCSSCLNRMECTFRSTEKIFQMQLDKVHNEKLIIIMVNDICKSQSPIYRLKVLKKVSTVPPNTSHQSLTSPHLQKSQTAPKVRSTPMEAEEVAVIKIRTKHHSMILHH